MVLLNDDRDMHVLLFLWRWKVATLATIARKFFPGVQTIAAYRSINRLIRGEFVRWRIDATGRKAILCLTKGGFHAIRPRLPTLREEGFASEAATHDLITQMLELGPLMVENESSVEIVTEQELRRVVPECLPPWVPRSTAHRPDGYLQIPASPGRGMLVAIEAELHGKRRSDYEILARHYAAVTEIHYVIWAVPTLTFARSLTDIFSDRDVRAHERHVFVCAHDLPVSGLMAPVRCGPRTGRPWAEMVIQRTFNEHSTLNALCILDGAKINVKAGSSSTITPHDVF